jgi:hypothetical protein
MPTPAAVGSCIPLLRALAGAMASVAAGASCIRCCCCCCGCLCVKDAPGVEAADPLSSPEVWDSRRSSWAVASSVCRKFASERSIWWPPALVVATEAALAPAAAGAADAAGVPAACSRALAAAIAVVRDEGTVQLA